MEKMEKRRHYLKNPFTKLFYFYYNFITKLCRFLLIDIIIIVFYLIFISYKM